MEIFNGVIKYKVDLPMVENDKDYWYCERLLNEAFLELDHHGKGPVQINVPIDYGVFAIDNTFTTEKLPKINVVERIIANSSEEKWKEKKEELKKYSKIILIYGQNNPISDEEKQKVDKFARKYNCIIASEKISNFSNEYSLDTGAVCRILSKEQMNKLAPDLVIVINGNYVSTLKGKLKAISKNFKSWLVSEEGMLQDQFENLSNIFECKTSEFLDKITTEEDIKNNKTYLNEWKNVVDKFKVPKLEYSNLYAMRELFENIPENSILNLSNSLTPRNASLFELKNKIPVYCNRGVNGIDGSMSTFIGQSYVTDKLGFLVIGDLSFFYDMNALWNRYLKKNLRIMLNNNQGAALLHFTTGVKNIPTLNNAIAAEHFSTAKGWGESQGFEYLCSHNKEEFDESLKKFINKDSDKPILFEVFTDKAKIKKTIKNIIKK